ACAEFPKSSADFATSTIIGIAYSASLATASSTVGNSGGTVGGGSDSGLTYVLHGHSSFWLTMHVKVSTHLFGTEASAGLFSK
ncbi:MAG: hypothetical protein ACKPKO_09630, partial [Candidatus Fonsibacter sp.]